MRVGVFSRGIWIVKSGFKGDSLSYCSLEKMKVVRLPC